MNRKLAKDQVLSDLATLASCCRSEEATGTLWPSSGLLTSLQRSVMLLIAKQRKKPLSPAWKAFRLLNKRMPSLLLVSDVDNLVKRARELLAESGESALDKLEREGDSEHAGKLLRDIESLGKDLSNAKAVDWAQHESAPAVIRQRKAQTFLW